jgi:prepilin-type N-terminal cleavage/methylation domain-containing protein
MKRRGFSLLEMMASTTIMAAVMGAVVVVVQSSYSCWNAHESDLNIEENAYAVLNHFVREMRQATTVTAISAASNNAGTLSITNASGTTETWALSGTTTTFNNGSGAQNLATSINQLNFVGYQPDGVTATTTVANIQMIKCTVQVTLSHGAGVTRTVSTTAWVRSW